jgi:hypothetical protein
MAAALPGRQRREPALPGSRDGADQAGPADRLAAPDQPAPSSRADLRHRLERLPPAHPSSPRSADTGRDQPVGPRDQDSRPPREQTPDRAATRDRADREPDAVTPDYWSQVPRFQQAWAEHARSWPGERAAAAAVDRSRDPAGSWRGDGNQYLDPQQHAQARDVIAGVQRAEQALTRQMGEVERQNASGGWLAGLEYRRKGEDRLKEKLADELGITPAMQPERAIEKVNDAIRYTFCFDPERYADGYWDVKQRLEAREHQMIYSKNHWRDDPEYKGINTRWVTPEGQRFEVQFHTPESFHAKQQVTHTSYERIRNPLTHDDERSELEAFQREVSSWITAPEGVQDIPDHRRKGR